MTYEHKDGSATLFPNNKGDNPKRPDFRGEGKIGGQDFEISAWDKQGKKGPFLSLSFKPKGERSQQGTTRDSDDIPFAQHERGAVA